MPLIFLVFFSFSLNASMDLLAEDIINKSKIQDNIKHQYIKAIKEKKINKKVPTFFYLYSTSLPKSNLINFFNMVNKLHDKVDKNLIGYGVFQGMTPKKIFHDFIKRFNYQSPSVIKVQPYIYKKFNITTVPAIIFSYCNTKEYFRFKNCDNKFIVRGDITLKKFISLMATKDKKFHKYYESLSY